MSPIATAFLCDRARVHVANAGGAVNPAVVRVRGVRVAYRVPNLVTALYSTVKEVFLQGELRRRLLGQRRSLSDIWSGGNDPAARKFGMKEQ